MKLKQGLQILRKRLAAWRVRWCLKARSSCLKSNEIGLACEQAPSEIGKKLLEKISARESERRDAASEASGTRGSP